MRVIRKNGREEVRLQLAEFQGSRYLDVRAWSPGEGAEATPTRKGVTIPLTMIGAFAEAVAELAREARQGAA